MIDVNCRPPLIVDRDSYRARVERAVTDVDLVKMSDDDMTYLYPDLGPGDAVERLLRLGVGAVLMTTGGDAVTVATGTGEARVPVTPVSVVDTVGAGDTFDGALLAWLVGNGSIARGHLGLPVIERAVVAANVAAGIACTRRGADPPSAEDVGSDWWS
jgi:fructokinase